MESQVRDEPETECFDAGAVGGMRERRGNWRSPFPAQRAKFFLKKPPTVLLPTYAIVLLHLPRTSCQLDTAHGFPEPPRHALP
jgi:hypothetical protein